ncbi:hypothetical protein BC830DRAFT_1113629 [Chytriomyces sp. MP71]|nr:hypothetical protein BC830DRAFT_1113629 [Chytriomyces sp. MP71]
MQMQQIQMQQMQMHPQMSQFHQTSQQQLPINAANASPNSSAIGALLSLREQPAGGMQEYGNYNSGYSVQPFSGQGGSFGQGQYGYSQNVYQQQPPLHTYQSMQQQQQQQQQNLIMNTHSPLLNNNAGSYSSTGNLNVQNLINSHPATPFHGQTIQFASTPHLLNTHSGNNNTFAIPQPTFKQTPLHTNSNYTAIADQRQSIATNPAFSPLPPNSTSTGGLLAAMSPNVIITAAPARTATLRAPTSISALASPNVHRMHPYRKSSALTPVVSGPASAHALLTMMSPLPPAAPNTDMGIDMSRVVNSPFLNNPPSAANQQSTGFMATAPQEFLERERAVAFLMQPSPYMQQAVAQARRAEADILASVDGVLGEGVAGAVGSVGAAGVDVMRAFGDAGEFGSGGVGDLF